MGWRMRIRIKEGWGSKVRVNGVCVGVFTALDYDVADLMS